MPNYYEIYRNSYNDFGIYNDCVPYFSMISDRYISPEELDERDIIRKLRKMGINESSYYLHLYDPNRILEYDPKDINSFYVFFPNWNDLMSAMFSVPVAKSLPFVKIDRENVLRDFKPEYLDKNIVENCNNIIYTLQKMCGPDTIVNPLNISSFFDKTKDDELMPYRKELTINALEEYFVRFLLLYGYAVNEIEKEDEVVPASMKFTHNIFVRYYNEVLIGKMVNEYKKEINLYKRLYDTHETINRERPIIIRDEDDNRLVAETKDRSLVIEPYYIGKIVPREDVHDVQFFNMDVVLSYLDQDLIDSLNISPMTKLDLNPNSIDTVRTLYERVPILVDTDADDFSVETEDYLIVGVEKKQGQFDLLCRNPGSSKITIKATREGCRENIKTLTITVAKPESTILVADPKELRLKVGEKKSVKVYTNANDFAHGIIGENADSIASQNEIEQGTIEITGIGIGNVQLRLIAKTLDLPTTVVYVPIEVVEEDTSETVYENNFTNDESSEPSEWVEEGTYVSEEQLQKAFFFTKRVLEAYVLTNVLSNREKEKVSSASTYKVINNQSTTIFEPFYLNDENTLKRAIDTNKVWEV